MKKLQWIYCAVLVVAAMLALLCEYEVLPVEYIGHDARILYFIDFYSIVIGFGTTFFALRMFVFQWVARSIQQDDEQRALAAYAKWSGLRLAVFAWTFCSLLLLYYATSYTSNPQYCLLIALVGYVFCWPSLKDFQQQRAKREKGKNEENSGEVQP